MFTLPVTLFTNTGSITSNPGNYKPTANIAGSHGYTTPSSAYDTTNYPDTTTSALGSSNATYTQTNHTFNGFASANGSTITCNIRHSWSLANGSEVSGLLSVAITDGTTQYGYLEYDGLPSDSGYAAAGPLNDAIPLSGFSGNINTLKVVVWVNAGQQASLAWNNSSHNIYDIYLTIS